VATDVLTLCVSWGKNAVLNLRSCGMV